jgi:hypothetical protein
MAAEGSLQDVKNRYEGGNALYIGLRHPPEDTGPLFKLDLVEHAENVHPGGITLYAKHGVSEAELYHKVIKTLEENSILPECIMFRRLTLEQIYIGIINGSLMPAV